MARGDGAGWVRVGQGLCVCVCVICFICVCQDDHLPQRVDKLHELLFSHRDRPVILYVHCEQGQDRTGQIIGAYQLKYGGMDWPTMFAYNREVTGRVPLPKHLNTLRYYCYHLQERFQNDLKCTTSDGQY